MDIKKIIEEKCSIFINSIDLIGEGYDSKAYRVNNEFVFKIKFSANKKKGYEKEKAIYDFLNKKLNTNINIPNIEYWYISDEISILGYKEVKGTFLTQEIYYSLSREKQELLKKDIAMFLRQLHDLDYSEISTYTIDNKQNVLEEYQLLKETIYDIFKDFEKQYIEDFMKKLHSTTIFDGKKCLCHNDFSCNHLLLDSDKRLTGVIDFGDSGIIDEYCDFIYLLEDSEEEIGSSFGEDILKLYGNIDIEKAKEYQDVVEQYYPIETIVYGIKNNKSDFVEKGKKEIYIMTHKEGNLTEEIFEMYKRNFPYINREEKTIKEIINNENNIVFERRNDDGKLIACAIVNRNTILLLVVDKEYRNQGLGKSLLQECENNIIKNGFDKIILGVGFDYLMPGVPTGKKFTTSVNENLNPLVNDIASRFFEKRGYSHSWGNCNCFDMKMKLSDFNQNDNSIGDTINNIYYRWATIDDLCEIVECADDACQFQDEKFSEYYKNIDLYNENNNQRVLVAVKDNKIVGTLIVSIETEGKDLGCVGCTCVSFKESHQKIGTTMVKLGTKYLKDIGLKNASLSYTYSGLDVLYGESGYEISTYYFMGEKNIEGNK